MDRPSNGQPRMEWETGGTKRPTIWVSLVTGYVYDSEHRQLGRLIQTHTGEWELSPGGVLIGSRELQAIVDELERRNREVKQ